MDLALNSDDEPAIRARVEYHGSLEDHWGWYRIAAAVATPDGTRYDLANSYGDVELRDVRRESFRVIPAGPVHRVQALHDRLIAVERQGFIRYGNELPAYLQRSIRMVPEVVGRNRHAEAEHYLLSLEVHVGCISSADFQRYALAIMTAGDDDSWAPWSQTELDDLLRKHEPSWKGASDVRSSR